MPVDVGVISPQNSSRLEPEIIFSDQFDGVFD